jgi:uncharacterized membrane protein
MSPEPTQPNGQSIHTELAFVQQALNAADKSERFSRVIVGLFAILAIVTFIWMHLHMFAPMTLASLLHSVLRVDLFFLILMFGLTLYLRQVMNRSTRTILRALANMRQQ